MGAAVSAATIKFGNLLDEARYVFFTGDYRKVEELLAEAHLMVASECRVVEGEAAS